MRDRIRERGKNLEHRAPGLCDRLRELPPDERRHRTAEFLQEELAVQAPPEEVLNAMGQVQRWRFLQRAESDGFWQKNGVTPETKAHLLRLPTPYFLEEMRRLERGDAPLGPPGNWRGEGHHERARHER